MDILEGVTDLKRDIKRLLKTLEDTDLAVAISVMQDFNKNIENTNLNELMGTMKQTNILLEQIDFNTLHQMGLVLNPSDIKELIESMRKVNSLIDALSQPEIKE